MLDNSDMQRLKIEYFGYFDIPGQPEPVYDPLQKAPCLFCFDPWTVDNVRTLTHILADRYGNTHSYFYRVHISCHEDFLMHHLPHIKEPPSVWLFEHVIPKAGYS